jgi:hypothetical protein
MTISVKTDRIQVGRKGEPLLIDGKLHKICRCGGDDDERDDARMLVFFFFSF